jgi:hypothetical protein
VETFQWLHRSVVTDGSSEPLDQFVLMGLRSKRLALYLHLVRPIWVSHLARACIANRSSLQNYTTSLENPHITLRSRMLII